MKFVQSGFVVLTPISDGGVDELKQIERAARTCYKSEGLITEDTTSAEKLIRNLIKNEHEAMLEHASLSVKFITDRATTHELVRHRMASFAQESQRYCNYSKDKFDNEITFIKPYWLGGMNPEMELPEGSVEFMDSLLKAEDTYFKLLDLGYSPQDARCVLPNCTKTEIVVTANYREWRHILKLRTDKAAAPEIRYLMRRLLNYLKHYIPVVFDDIEWWGR